MAYAKPVPVADEVSAGFWNAAKQHTLAFQRCQHCGHYAHPPGVVCPKCHHAEPSFKFEPVSGRGRIKAWTIMRDAFIPSFRGDIPWVIVTVEMEEQKGLRMVTRLMDGPKAALKLDAHVEAFFEDVTPEVTLPQFRLRKA